MIVTLSTIPPRFNAIGRTLQSLLRQRHAPEKIVLYIPERYRRFPEWQGVLPDVPEGVSIHRTPVDLGPATKVLPAIRAFAGRDIDILFCDDDVAYDREWAQRFAALRKTRPATCLTEGGKNLPDIDPAARRPGTLPRAGSGARSLRFRLASMLKYRQRRASIYSTSGYCDIFYGVSGVMVRPEFFSEAVFDIPDILWTVDDCWLSGHLETRNIPIWLNADAPRRADGASRRVAALINMVEDGHDRPAANQACVDYYRRTYGIWPKEPAAAQAVSAQGA